MSLVTYPCSDCKLAQTERETGADFCASETGSECGEYLEAREVEDQMLATIALFDHRHYSKDTRGDIARGMAQGFADALDALGASLDEDTFLHLCEVRS